MIRLVPTSWVLLFGLVTGSLAQTPETARSVIIITDARPVMELLAAGLKSAENITVDIAEPADLPASLGSYRAAIVAIDGVIPLAASAALQAYTNAGGRLILIHQSVAPHQPAEWLAFVGVKFASGDVAPGGGIRVARAPVALVALTHRSPVIETKVAFDRAVVYRSTSRPRDMRLPGLSFPPTDVFLDHSHVRLKRPLMGIKLTDPRSGVTYMQDAGIWVEELEQGVIYYFMIGQAVGDFQIKPYVQMIANAVVTQ